MTRQYLDVFIIMDDILFVIEANIRRILEYYTRIIIDAFFATHILYIHALG